MATRFDDWEGDFLAHHGIKGQKWGVRRFQNPDGTLTKAGRLYYGFSDGATRKMSRQYNRGIRKLNKLAAKADIKTQKEAAEKYDRRAKTALKVAGVGAAIAGASAGAEIGGRDLRYQLLSRALKNSRNEEWKKRDLNSKEYRDNWLFWDDQRRKLDGTETGDWNHIYDMKQQFASDRHRRNEENIINAGRAERANINEKAKMANSIRQGVFAAGTAVAAAGGGVAAYNKIKAHLAKKRTTDEGHAKAVAKGQAQLEKMFSQFKDTPYAELLKKQAEKNGMIARKHANGQRRRG